MDFWLFKTGVFLVNHWWACESFALALFTLSSMFDSDIWREVSSTNGIESSMIKSFTWIIYNSGPKTDHCVTSIKVLTLDLDLLISIT